MKKYFLLLLPLLMTSLYSEEETDDEQLVASLDDSALFAPSYNKEESINAPIYQPTRWEKRGHVLLYGEADIIIIPGMGIGYRTQNERSGFEVSGSFYFLGAKASFSGLRYFSPSRETHGYAGIGVGAMANIFLVMADDSLVRPYVPVFIGFERKGFFADIGVDLVYAIDSIGPLPALRIGGRF